eukprot:gi/632959531/ref/XP_007895674.1/ PREDICTED: uncharacterized protein LOC103181194 [Callorhinchus milii]
MFTLLLVTVVGSLVLANEDKHVSGEKGSTISFDCNPWPYKDSGKTKAHFRHQRDEKYFCKHPCGPYNWHSVVANTRRGHSTGSRFSISKIQNSDGARVQITQLSDSDAGTWWCGTERPYGDLYQKIVINVLKSQQSKITEVTKVPTSEEEELIEEMAVSGEEDDWILTKQKIQSATRALSICNDNHACALLILQAGSLETKHCWICQQMSSRLHVVPLSTVKHVNITHKGGTIPNNMAQLLLLAQNKATGDNLTAPQAWRPIVLPDSAPRIRCHTRRASHVYAPTWTRGYLWATVSAVYE